MGLPQERKVIICQNGEIARKKGHICLANIVTLWKWRRRFIIQLAFFAFYFSAVTPATMVDVCTREGDVIHSTLQDVIRKRMKQLSVDQEG